MKRRPDRSNGERKGCPPGRQDTKQKARLLGLWLALLAILLSIGCVLTTPQPTPTSTALPPTALPPTETPTPTTEPTSTVVPEPTHAAPFWEWSDLAPYRQAMLPAFAGVVDRFANGTRYAIDLHVDVRAHAFRGTAQVRYTNHESQPLAEIAFRLLPNTPGYGSTIAISTVSVNGVETEPEFQFARSALYVPLRVPLAPGEMVEIALAFEGTLPTDGSAGYAQYGYIEGVLALPNFYPMIPVYDDEGWNVELAPIYGDATFSDTALYAVRVTLPADMVVAVSGTIIEQRENTDGTVTYVAASGPMRDFNLVASADYRTLTKTVGEVLITLHYLPGDMAGGERALDYAARALEIFQELIGPYPFTELDVVATPTTAGGIEYPGLIVVAESLYDRVGGFFELATVHEVAHQWWYGLVGNDQLDEPWLDEALTQYTSLLYFERRYGEEAAQRILEDVFRAPYRRIQQIEQDMAVGLPVEAYSEDLYGAVVYGKGPLFFHEMRLRVGDDAFYEILSAYLDQHLYGVAYPSDFMAIAEQVSGQDLGPLYEQWILGTQR